MGNANQSHRVRNEHFLQLMPDLNCELCMGEILENPAKLEK